MENVLSNLANDKYTIENLGCIDTIRKSTLVAFLSVLLYKVSLDVSYYSTISLLWEYAKFSLQINWLKVFESYFLLFMIFLLMPKSPEKLSSVMIWLFILLSYIPMLVLFSLKDESRLFVYGTTGFWIVIFIILRQPGIKMRFITESRIILKYFSLSVVIISAIWILKYTSISLNFDLSKIYEIRSQFANLNVPLAGYLFRWLCYIINPMIFAYLLLKKRYFFVIGVVLFQFVIFSATGNKTILFALLYSSALVSIVNRKYKLAWIAFGLSFVVVLGIFAYWVLGDVWTISLFTRRTLLSQPLQYFLYYDFFSNNSFTFLSQHNLIGAFIEYPYHLKPAYIIGELYYENPLSHANTGLVGDAYMNFGFPGLFLWAIFMGLLLKLIDSCAKGVDVRIGSAIIAMPVFTLINGALLTNLFTHGLFLAIFVLYLVPKKSA